MKKQITKTFKQTNFAPPEKVFPLLCPVREHDWLDGWQADIIHSMSGVAEQNCVFKTPNTDGKTTYWIVSNYQLNTLIEFVRVHPGENVVKIEITLKPNGLNQTSVFISYCFTALSEEQINHLNNGLDKQFIDMMEWWEKAINHYLLSGEKLLRQ